MKRRSGNSALNGLKKKPVSPILQLIAILGASATPFPERDAWSPPWLSRELLRGEATGPLKEPVMVG